MSSPTGIANRMQDRSHKPAFKQQVQDIAQQQKAANPDADSPLYRTDEFRMYCFKVLPCSKRFVHDWVTCPFAHPGEKAKRRDPRLFNYSGIACLETKKGSQCPRGEGCPYAHNVFEFWLHPSRYRTQLCNDGSNCRRKVCFFAHALEELRVSGKIPPADSSSDPGWSTAVNGDEFISVGGFGGSVCRSAQQDEARAALHTMRTSPVSTLVADAWELGSTGSLSPTSKKVAVVTNSLDQRSNGSFTLYGNAPSPSNSVGAVAATLNSIRAESGVAGEQEMIELFHAVLRDVYHRDLYQAQGADNAQLPKPLFQQKLVNPRTTQLSGAFVPNLNQRRSLDSLLGYQQCEASIGVSGFCSDGNLGVVESPYSVMASTTSGVDAFTAQMCEQAVLSAPSSPASWQYHNIYSSQPQPQRSYGIDPSGLVQAAMSMEPFSPSGSTPFFEAYVPQVRPPM